MKRFISLFCVGSLVVNAILLFILLASAGATHLASERLENSTGQKKVKNENAALGAIDAKTWSELNGEDLPHLVSRLRAAGFPPAIVRSILRYLVDQQFEER